MKTTERRPSRPAAALAVLLSIALANASCATTSIMFTDYRARRSEQYRLLWVDAAVVGSSLAVGAPLYALSESGSTREGVGLGLLIGAAVWAGWTAVFVALLRMPDGGSQSTLDRAPRLGPHPASGGRALGASWTAAHTP